MSGGNERVSLGAAVFARYEYLHGPRINPFPGFVKNYKPAVPLGVAASSPLVLPLPLVIPASRSPGCSIRPRPRRWPVVPAALWYLSGSAAARLVLCAISVRGPF